MVRVVGPALEKLWGEPGWGAAVLFAIAQNLVLELALLPGEVYFEYFHEHAYGLSGYSALGYVWDTVKGTALNAAALAMLAFGLFGLARRVRRWWLLLGAAVGALLLVSAALDSYRSRLFFEQAPLPPGELRTRIVGLLAKAGIEFSDIRVEKTSRASKKLDAYFAGQGPTRAVVLNDVLLEKLSTEEILAAVAHEAGHVREPRWPGRLAAVAGGFALLFLIHQVLAWAARRRLYGSERYGDIRVLPLIGIVYFLVMFPVTPISHAFSRERERKADAFGIALTGNPAAFRSMLVKAARVNKMDPEPPRWFVLLHYGHPPIGERIADAEAAEKRLSVGGPP